MALFFILSGFVNALKPIKLAKSGQIETALSNLAVSSFRRTFRLMLPAAAATLLSWTLCQMGAYEYARHGDAYWLYTYTPGASSTWGTALDDLVVALGRTWTLGEVNYYDQPQWALVYLLQGSMMIFCALLVTINLRPTWRLVCLGIFALWSFDWSYKIRDRKFAHLKATSSPLTTRIQLSLASRYFSGSPLQRSLSPTFLKSYQPCLHFSPHLSWSSPSFSCHSRPTVHSFLHGQTTFRTWA